VATFALIHGGGGSAWDWHLVAPALRERLGIEADEIDGGHYISISRPVELAGRLDAYAASS
jgi:hypothetical protein